MQKQNLKYQITYILIILFFVIGSIFYRQPFCVIMVVLLFVLPFISIWITKILAPKITVSFVSKTASIVVNNDIIMEVSLKNPTWFSFLNCELSFKYSNLYYPLDSLHNLSLSAPLKKNNTCVFKLNTRYSGICEITYFNFRITDPLHLYTRCFNDAKTFYIPVLPKLNSKTYPVFPESFLDTENDDIAVSKGSLNQELKEIREYRPGDRLQNIHWKLSSKMDDLLVKEMQESASRTLCLLPELSSEDIENTLSTVWSYMNYLISANLFFGICITNYNSSEIEYCMISNLDEAYDALLKIYYMPLYNNNNFGVELFKKIYGADNPVIQILGNNIGLK